MSCFARHAEEILEAAQSAAGHGSVSGMTLLMSADGALRMFDESSPYSDWPLESLAREHGASSAYRVASSCGGTRVEARSGGRTLHLQAPSYAQQARRLLNSPRW